MGGKVGGGVQAPYKKFLLTVGTSSGWRKVLLVLRNQAGGEPILVGEARLVGSPFGEPKKGSTKASRGAPCKGP